MDVWDILLYIWGGFAMFQFGRYYGIRNMSNVPVTKQMTDSLLDDYGKIQYFEGYNDCKNGKPYQPKDFKQMIKEIEKEVRGK